MTELKVRAVLIGSLVDILGSFILGAAVFAVVSATTGVTATADLTRLYDASAPLQLVTLALGLVMTATGAFVAARLTPGTERLHAFAVGAVSTLMGFSIVFSAPESSPFWSQAASLILTIPAAFAGGEIRRAIVKPARKTP